MRKLSAILVLILLTSNSWAQKTGNWETGNPAPHVPTANTYEKVVRQLPLNADAELVRQTLLELKPTVLGSGCDLALQHEVKSPGGYHYTYRQTYKGLPIYQASIKANLTRAKRFMSVLNTLKPVTNTPGVFSVTKDEVKDHLFILYYRDNRNFSFEIEQCYFPSENGLVPAFRVEVVVGNGLWEVVIDGQDLMHTLTQRDLASYARPMKTASVVDTTGVAMVFNPDPLSSSARIYGGNFVDNTDADSPFLNDQRVMVNLQEICYNGTNFILQGPYVKLEDAESPPGAPAFTSDGNFIFTRAQQGFEDAMCYYHIDTYQRYIQSLGFMNLMNVPLTVDPHGLNGQDNSHFVPQGGNIRLAFGEGGVDDAEDADVIIHEYGHALSYSAAPGSNGGTERQGLDEGFGDYMAASYSKFLHFASWKNTFTWDGHNEFWSGRSASTPTLYPPTSTDIYTYGEIWASTLMEVFDQIGRTDCDKVFFQSLYGSNISMTLTDAAQVALDADSMLFNGAHTLEYQLAFCRRGIFTGSAPGQSCFVGRAESTDPDSQWLIFPNPAQTAFTINVADLARRQDVRYEVVDLLGQVLQVGSVTQAFTKTSVADLAMGIYLVRLWEGGALLGSKRLNVLR